MSAVATGVGSLPFEYDEAVRVVLGELPDLPHVPEVPGRGVHAAMTGRGLAVVSGLAADLQPAGWRLVDSSGVDHRRAVSLLAQDLDTVEELAQGVSGSFKTQVIGPWTLAATVEKPRGGKVLGDHGARREVAQALAEGIGEHLRDLRRRLPGIDRWIVQLDEPGIAAVGAGRVPTASGFGRLRSIEPAELSEHLQWVVAAVHDAGAEAWVHSCAPQTPWSVILDTGVQGLSADLSTLGPEDLDTFARAVESDRNVALGVVASQDPGGVSSDAAVVERVLRWFDMLGLDVASVSRSTAITPTCGLAGADPAWARRALELARSVAKAL